MNLLLLGKPGCGKGSLSTEFAKHEACYHISTGDIFRKEISLGSELGKLADSYISKGQLCPDDVTCEIIKNAIIENKDKSILFDGFPRTIIQADRLQEMMTELNIKLDAVIDFDVSDNVVIERLSSRRICKNCNAIYNTRNHNPKIDGVCDICGGEVYARDDDKIESIVKRLSVYNEKTKPLIDYYNKLNLLIKVDGTLDSHELYNVVKNKVNDLNLSSL